MFLLIIGREERVRGGRVLVLECASGAWENEGLLRRWESVWREDEAMGECGLDEDEKSRSRERD